jgi:ATP-dependent DNA ligase
MPPLKPMLSKAVGGLDAVPEVPGVLFEPKWDGFRCIVFRDGDDIELASRNERPFTRYFPELLEPLKANLPKRCVIDGELVIHKDGCLEFELLQMRLHPAESRVKKLAAEIPASVVAFDMLCEGAKDLRGVAFAKRRERLEKALSRAEAPIHLTPATRDRTVAADWFKRFEGAGLDGVIAKGEKMLYEPNKRVMLKVKHLRTADCVVAGYRDHKDGDGVGSLLLGLYDDAGDLHHVGVASSFAAPMRKQLKKEIADLEKDALHNHPWKDWADAQENTGRMPGAGNRWNAKKDMSWKPLRAERVAEVAYEHLQGDRFRHTARVQRWRPDRDPESCTYAQLESPVPIELTEVFGV